MERGGTEAGKLGPGLATLLVAGNMIGSGVYLLPATLGSIGSVSLIGWLLATLGALLLALVFSLLGRLRPTQGGVAAYAGEGLGRFFGFHGALLYWACCWIGNVAIAVAVTGYLTAFLPTLRAPWAGAASTVGVLWLMTAANLFGARFVGKLGGLTLVFGLVPVLLVATAGWFWFEPAVFGASWNVSGRPAALTVQASLVSVFWAFLGLECAALAARAVRDPARNVPIATLGGVLLAAVIYIAATSAILGVIPARELAASSAPFADVVGRIAGPAAAGLVAACALIKASGTLAGWLLVTAETTRWTAAAGFFPRRFARVRADGVAALNLLAMAVLMSGVAVLTVSPTLGEQFTVLINVAVVLSLIVYAYCCLALLRFSAELAERRVRTLARAAAIGGLAFSVWVALASGAQTLAAASGLLAVTAAIWIPLRRAERGGLAGGVGAGNPG